jgi:hypothetical protein
MWKINRKDKFLNSGMKPEDMEENFDWDDDEFDEEEADEYDDYHGSDHDLGGTGHGDDSFSDADNYL